MKLMLYTNHATWHGGGQTPLWEWGLSLDGSKFTGRKLRVTVGGYGWCRPRYRPHYKRYRRVATHFGIGPVCFSIVTARW